MPPIIQAILQKREMKKAEGSDMHLPPRVAVPPGHTTVTYTSTHARTHTLHTGKAPPLKSPMKLHVRHTKWQTK